MEQSMLEIASSSSTISHQSKENENKKRPCYSDKLSSGKKQTVQETMLSHESPRKKRRSFNSSDETNSFPDDVTSCKESCVDGDSPQSALIEESEQMCQTEKNEIVGSESNKQLVSEEDEQKPRAKVLCSSTGGLPNSSVLTTLTSSTDSSPVSGSVKNTEGQDMPKDGHSVKLLKESVCFGNGSTKNNVTDAVPALFSAETSQTTACCQEDKTSGSSFLLDQSNVKATDEHRRRKLLILDVNGLLADILPDPEPGYIVDTWFAMKAVFKRTFCNDFLQFCFDNFNVGVWSSRNRRNVESVVDFLMGEKKNKLLFCWDQAHCTNTGHGTVADKRKPLFLKEIKKLWDKEDPSLPWEKGDYNESNTLLMDDSPHKALRNPLYTGIFPYPYVYKDNTDTLLGPKGKLRLYLQRLLEAEHVQKFVENNPYGQRPITKSNAYWPYYSKILNPTASSKPEKNGSSEPEKKGDDDRSDEPKSDIKNAEEPEKKSSNEQEKMDDNNRPDEPKIDAKQEPEVSSEQEKKGDNDRSDEPKNDAQREPTCEASTSEVATCIAITEDPRGFS